MGTAPFLVGEKLSLADLHLAPIFAHLLMTQEAEALLAGLDRLRRWWQRMSERPSIGNTVPKFG
jgi:glutathione S-transferase